MKKIILGFMATCLLLTFNPLQSSAITKEKPSKVVALKPEEAAKVKILEARLTEINAMDKEMMKPSEKKALRKEVRSIKSQLNDIGGGVYISAGAIILILILIIILL